MADSTQKNRSSNTNKFDVEIADIHFKTERYVKTCKYILTLLLVSIICYTLIKVMSFPVDNIKALGAVVGGDKKLLAGSVIVNISLSAAWFVTYSDNRALRRNRT